MAGLLVVFDVDGTLCDTCEVDEECYVRACAEWLGEEARRLDWSTAPQITDRGILEWMSLELLSRRPSAGEAREVERRFLRLLREARSRQPGRFRAIPGAGALLGRMAVERWSFVAATGGWRASALLKLRAAGLPTGLLAASSSDTPDRARIFELAASRTGAGGDRHERVVLVGDGVWDVRTARELGWGFVGVAAGPGRDRLREAGAEHLVEDFTDPAALRDALGRARVLRGRALAVAGEPLRAPRSPGT